MSRHLANPPTYIVTLLWSPSIPFECDAIYGRP